jgi:selenocysteine-specific elongation factor
VDRVFTVAGFGTVVTGTLSDGSFVVGQEVEIQPSGLKARIRGLQTHKEKIESAVPGSRVAINLTGVGTDEVQRGDIVTSPGWLRPTTLVDCHLRYLPDAPGPLKHNAAVEFYSGAAETQARIRLLGARVLAPGEEGWVQLRLAKPVALVQGDRFIIRQPSPSVTIGGGRVINPFPGRRHRRFRPEVIERLETLAHGSPDEILLQALERQQPCEVRELLGRSGLAQEQARQSLVAMVSGEQIFVLGGGEQPADPASILLPANFLVTRSGWGALRERTETLLDDYHRQFPLRTGMPREEVKSRLARYLPNLTSRLFGEVVKRAAEEGWLVETGSTIRLAQHRVSYTPKQQQAVDFLLYTFRQDPYTTPSVTQCEEQVGAEVLNALLEQGQLIKLNEDVVLLTETYEDMRDRLLNHLKAEGTITVAQVRDMFGTSRKYALAFLGYLDEKRITRRVGDERVLR